MCVKDKLAFPDLVNRFSWLGLDGHRHHNWCGGVIALDQFNRLNNLIRFRFDGDVPELGIGSTTEQVLAEWEGAVLVVR